MSSDAGPSPGGSHVSHVSRPVVTRATRVRLPVLVAQQRAGHSVRGFLNSFLVYDPRMISVKSVVKVDNDIAILLGSVLSFKYFSKL